MFFGANGDGRAEYLESQTVLAHRNGIRVTDPFQNNSNPRFWFDQLWRHSSQLQKLDQGSAPQIHWHFNPNIDSNSSFPFKAKSKEHDHIRRHTENIRKKSRGCHIWSAWHYGGKHWWLLWFISFCSYFLCLIKVHNFSNSKLLATSAVKYLTWVGYSVSLKAKAGRISKCRMTWIFPPNQPLAARSELTHVPAPLRAAGLQASAGLGKIENSCGVKTHQKKKKIKKIQCLIWGWLPFDFNKENL